MTKTPFFSYLCPPLVVAMALCAEAQAADADAAVPNVPEPPASAPVRAAEAPPQVEVVSSRTEERRQASNFKQILVAADLERYGDANLLDVLRRQPGIVVSGVPGRRGGEISMRGMGSAYVRILLNGDPAPPNFALDSLAPDLVERVEILALPTVELGTQAIAGTINIILKRTSTKRQRQLKAGLFYDNDRAKPQLSGTFGDQYDSWSWLVTSAVRRQSSDDTYLTLTDGADQDGILQRRLRQFNQDRGWNWNIAPRLTKRLSGGDSLSLQSYLSGNIYDSAGFDRTQFLVGARTPFADDTYTSSGRALTVRNNLTWLQTVAPSSKLTVKAGMTFASNSAGSAVDFVDQDGVFSNHRDTGRDDRRRSVTASANLRTAYQDKHAFVVGAELERNRDDLSRVDRLDHVSQLDQSGNRFDVDSSRYAVYAQDEWDLSARWSAYFGLRWERVALDSDSDLGQHVSYSKPMLSPVLQTVWRQPDAKAGQLRLGVARSWRLPPTESLAAARAFSAVNTVTQPDTSGNPTLRPERAWAVEAAYERYLDKENMFSVGVFVRQIADVTLTQTSLENGRWVAMPFNKGNAQVRGITLETKNQLSRLIADAPKVELRTSLTRSWSSVDAVPGPNNRLGRQAPMTFNIGADYALKASPVSVGATAGYVWNGEVRVSPFESGAASNQRLLEGYVLWKFKPAAQLRLSASNMLHRDEVKRTSFLSDTLSQTKEVTAPTYLVARAILELQF